MFNNLQFYKKAKSKNAAATKAIFLASIKSKYACGTDIGCIEEVYQKSIVNYGCVAAGKSLDCRDDNASQESESERITH